MVVGFTTTYAINAHHHEREFEFSSGKVYSIPHYAIKLCRVDFKQQSLIHYTAFGGCHGLDRMIVEFTTTYAIKAYCH